MKTLFAILFFSAIQAAAIMCPEALNPTIYYKPVITFDASKCEKTDLMEMISPQGKVLTTLCGVDYRNCLMQGACFVINQERILKSYNYYARGEDGTPRFKEVDLRKCPFGYGVRNACLEPYFTVAADMKFHKPGEVIYVPRLVGQVMPDGQIHDGYFVIRDTGAAMQGPHRFDFFTGFESHLDSNNPFARLGFGDKNNSFEFRKASLLETTVIRERTRYPGLRKDIVLPPHLLNMSK